MSSTTFPNGSSTSPNPTSSSQHLGHACALCIHTHTAREYELKNFSICYRCRCVLLYFISFLSSFYLIHFSYKFFLHSKCGQHKIYTHLTMNRACIFEEVRTLMDILLDAMCFCRTCNAFNMLKIVFDRKQYETDGFGTVHTTTRSTTTTTTSPTTTTTTSIAEYTMNIEYRALKNDGHKFKSLPHHQFQKVRLYMFRMQRITYRKKDLKQLYA